MKNSLAIFLQDLKNIKRVPLVGVILIGLAILPSLYAWFNLSASWDPYGNTGDVTVAVVNKDEGTEFDGVRVDIGEELEASLMENDQLGWTMVDGEEEARDGVKKGDFYAAVMVPEDFSQSLMSVMEGTPQQGEVRYVVNEKVNAIAPKMTDSGASTITRQINEQFSGETSSLLFAVFDELGIQLEEELPTFRAMKDVVYELEELMPEAMRFGNTLIAAEEDWDQLEEYVDTILAFEEKIPAVETYAEGIIELDESFDEINEQSQVILTLESELHQLENALDGLNTLNNILPELNQEVDRLLEEGGSLQGEGDALIEELIELETQGDDLLQEMDRMALHYEDATKFAEEGFVSLDEGGALFQGTLTELENALVNFEDQQVIDDLLEYVQSAQTDIDGYLKTLDELERMLLWLDDNYSDVDVMPVLDVLQSYTEELKKYQAIIDEMATHLEEEDVGAEQLNRWLEQLEDVQSSLMTGIEAFEEHEEEIERLAKKAVRLIEAEFDNLGEEELSEYLKSFIHVTDELLNSVAASLDDLHEFLDSVDDEQVDEALATYLNELGQQLQTVEEMLVGIIDGLETMAAYDISEELNEGVQQIEAVQSELRDVQAALNQLESALLSASDSSDEYVTKLIDAVESTKQQVDEARSWLMNEGLESASALDEQIRLQNDRLHDAVGNYQSLMKDMQHAVEVGQESAGEVFSSVRHVSEHEFPKAQQLLQEITDELNAIYPQLEKRVSELAVFVREDLPVAEQQVHTISRFAQEDLPGIIEDYEEVQAWLVETGPEISEGVSRLAAFASEDLPEIDEQVTSVSNKVRQLEEDERIQEMIGVLRNDLANEEAFFKEPVVLDEEQLFPIPNYGSANVPFYTPLALWVGALLLSNLVTTNLQKPVEESPLL